MERSYLELAFNIQWIDATEDALSSTGTGFPVRRHALGAGAIPQSVWDSMLNKERQLPLHHPPPNDRKSHRNLSGNRLPMINGSYHLHGDSQTWKGPVPARHSPSLLNSNVFCEDKAPPLNRMSGPR